MCIVIANQEGANIRHFLLMNSYFQRTHFFCLFLKCKGSQTETSLRSANESSSYLHWEYVFELNAISVFEEIQLLVNKCVTFRWYGWMNTNYKLALGLLC